MQNNNSSFISLKKNEYLRLTRRYSARNFVLYYFFIIIIKIILGIVFLNSVYVTRHYIINPDKFWEKTFKNDSLLNLQSYCAFTGSYLICNSIFLFILNIFITLHIYCGGLKRRLQYANIVFIIFQTFLFIYSTYAFSKFTNLISLFIILFGFSFFNLLLSIIYFILIEIILLKEKNDYILSINEMVNDIKKQLKNYEKESFLDNSTNKND